MRRACNPALARARDARAAVSRTSARACCISPSTSARCSPTRWASARRSRRSPPARCSTASRARRRVLVVTPASRSRPSGRSRSRSSPTCRCTSSTAPPARLALYDAEPRRSSPSPTTSRSCATSPTSTAACSPTWSSSTRRSASRTGPRKPRARSSASQSRYAFVLTGTPIENRIDELYSIVDFLDPQVFGPLFRFNREFYALDERGRPVGYRNLDRAAAAHPADHAAAPQGPGRDPAARAHRQQPLRADVRRAARALRRVRGSRRPPRAGRQAPAAHAARSRRSCSEWLACMRMLCDTPYILTPTTRDLPEARRSSRPILDDRDVRHAKAIVFSEWERMLELVRDLVRARGPRLRLAHRLGAAAEAARGDQPLQDRPRLPRCFFAPTPAVSASTSRRRAW